MATKSKPKAVKRVKGDIAAEDNGPILELIANLLPNFPEWIDMRNGDLLGATPRELIGTPQERFLRDMLLRYKYGIFS